MPLPQAHPDARIARFGVFEVDVAAGSLLKKGSRLRLQEQPFQILVALLDRPGDVVTREELRQRLWPADTFVDFDHSLNTAIKKIREALGDSASSPRFVETLARRGYRFLAPVEWVQPGVATPANPGADEKPTPVHPELEVPVPRRSVTRVLFGLIQAMYLVFYAAALFRLQAIDQILQSFLPPWGALALLTIVLVTAGIGIPLRCYLLSAVVFDYRRLGEAFRQMFPWLLLSDELWAAAPLLLMQNIGFGEAFAATAALLYLPFSERTLIRLAY